MRDDPSWWTHDRAPGLHVASGDRGAPRGRSSMGIAALTGSGPTTAPQPGIDRSSSPSVIFLHIGKTAGTTLRKIMYRHFARDEVLLVRNRSRSPARLRREETLDILASVPEVERARARLVLGHVIFGVHRLLPQPSTYVTLLRRPTSLVVSQYQWVRQDPTHWLHAKVAEEDMTLEQYVESGISLETDNSQTRAIAGDTTTPFGACDDELLERAKRNIDRHFAVVGLTERFDESLILFRRVFGWSNLHYAPANVSLKWHRRPVPGSLLERIGSLNRFDAELYEYVQQRFQQVTDRDPEFEAEVRRFRRSNSLYRWTWGAATYTLPKTLVSLSGARRSRITRPARPDPSP